MVLVPMKAIVTVAPMIRPTRVITPLTMAACPARASARPRVVRKAEGVAEALWVERWMGPLLPWQTGSPLCCRATTVSEMTKVAVGPAGAM